MRGTRLSSFQAEPRRIGSDFWSAANPPGTMTWPVVMAPKKSPPTRPAGSRRRWAHCSPLAGQAGLPAWLHPASVDVAADAEGMRGSMLLSANHDFAGKDFILDLLFKFDEDDDEFRAGFGEQQDYIDNGHGMVRMAAGPIYARITGPKHHGEVQIAADKDNAQIPLGKIGASAGPHLLRLCKAGNTFTVCICPDYRPGDSFAPTLAGTVPNLAVTCPSLNKTNGQPFIGGHATWMAISLSVDGKPVPTGVAGSPAGSDTANQTPVVRAGPANNNAKTALKAPAVGELLPLGGQAGLPPWLHAAARCLCRRRRPSRQQAADP